jgi:hypothetical protein
MDNQTAYEHKARVGMALELQRLSDEVSRLTENQRLQDSATAAVMERAEKAEAELAACQKKADAVARAFNGLHEQLEACREEAGPDLLVEAINAMVDDGWLDHGPEGMTDAQAKLYHALYLRKNHD